MFVVGQLEVRFFNGECNVLANGQRCGESPCDPYIRIMIDGVKDFDSHAEHDITSPTFNFNYYSSIIRNTSKVTVELWDHDYGKKNDDLMSSWSFFPIYKLTRVNRIDGKKWPNALQNKIFFRATWTKRNIHENPEDIP